MVAVCPPEYWPRPAYAALLQQVDCFVLADTFQYSRQSFQNRARVRTPQGWQWLSVPLRGGQHGRPICDVRLRDSEPWQRKHRRALLYNYRTTPYFEFYEPTLAPLLERPWDRLGELTCATIEVVHGLLDLPARLVRASAWPGAPATLPAILDRLREGHPEEHLLTLPAAAPHQAPVAPALHVLHDRERPYRQNFEGFVPGMSVLDLLFNYGPETRRMLEARTELRAYRA